MSGLPVGVVHRVLFVSVLLRLSLLLLQKKSSLGDIDVDIIPTRQARRSIWMWRRRWSACVSSWIWIIVSEGGLPRQLILPSLIPRRLSLNRPGTNSSFLVCEFGEGFEDATTACRNRFEKGWRVGCSVIDA